MLSSTPCTTASKAIIAYCHLFLKNNIYKIFLPLLAFLSATQVSQAQTAYTMSSGNKTWDLAGTWTVSGGTYTGTDAGNWASVGIIGSGTSVTTGVRTTKSSATIVSSTSGGLQKPSGTIQFLSTGSSGTPEAVAIDLLLDFTGRTAGTLSFDWAAIDNSSGTRPTSLRVFWSTDGTNFTEITGAQLLDKESATAPASGSVTSVALPTQFSGSSTARLRFYNHAGTNATGSGNRDKFQIDNIAVTSTVSAFSVTYNGNGNTGGTVPVDGSSPYNSGSNVTVLSAGTLVKTGSAFAGWNTAANGSGTAYAPGGTISSIAANTTLYAQWTINTYTVTYNGNGNDGGSAPVDGNSPYNYNSNVTVLGAGTLTRTGFTFNGWNTAANGSGTAYPAGDVITGIAANIALFAQWIPANSYAVTYDGNGNTGGTDPVDGSSPYTGGSNVTVLGAGTLVRTGYTFNGWNTAANGSGTAYAAGATISNISASVTLYAQWLINTYTVTYDGNTNTGGAAPVDGSSPYNYNSNVTVLGAGTLVKTNYNFTGWNTAANGSGTAYAAGATITGISANTTLFAQWAIITYTVTYNGNTNTGGTAPADGSSPYAIGSDVTVLGAGSLVKTGYSFGGWNTAANGSGTAYAAGGTISNLSANTVLYAQWTINTYTVIYNGNGNTGGTAPVDANSPYNFGSTVTVLGNTGNLTITGGTFIGWNTAADGSGTSYAPAATFTLGAANVVLYARWALPLYESFNYTAGGNVGGSTSGSGTTNNNWTTHSNSQAGTINVVSGSLSYTGLQASAGNRISIPGSNGTVARDINRNAGLTASQNTTYFSFLLNVTDATQLATTFGTGGNGYFIHLGSISGTSGGSFTSKVHIRSSNAAANFRLGISETGNTPNEATGDLNFGTTYLVVVKYVYNNTAGNDQATLWVNPSSLGGTEPVGGVTGPGSVNVASYNSTTTGICIRNASGTPKADIDEIRTGTTWASVTPAVTYQLTTTAGTGGTITAPASSPVTVSQGAATTITATANAGYTFTGWTVEAGSATIANAALISTTVTLNSGNASVKANFVASNFTITATAQTAGGSISPSGAVSVSSGASQAFTIIKDACNDIADVIVDGATSVLGDMVGNTYTFTNVTADHTIDVYFNPSTSTTWTGAVNNDWNNAGNWTSCVPDATLDVTIPQDAALYPILNVDAEVNSLSITGLASLVLNGKTLTINGGYSADPTASLIGSDASSLVVNSTITLSSAGTIRLHDLTINGGTTTLASAVEISGGAASVLPGQVLVQAGSQLQSNGFLTIKSNAFGTARVAQGDDAGNYITGDVTVERYIPANSFRSWRLLSVPTFGTQTIRQGWQEGSANPSPMQNNTPGFGVQITGTGALATAQANGFDNVAPSPAFYSWSGSAWTGMAGTNSAIATTKGYFLFIRGDRSQGLNASGATVATTLRTKGQLYQGTQAIPAFPANGFNLVGNLYASAIDFTQLSRTGGVNNLFYIWDSKKLNGSSLGAYQTFSATNSFQCLLGGGSYTLGQPNTTIESGQAFFVKTGATGGTITLTEGSKATSSGNLGFRPVAPANSLVKLDTRLYAANSPAIADANVVVFDNQYSNDVAEEDAVKLANPAENFGIQKGDKIIAIEGRKTIGNTGNISFNMSNLQQQEYILEFAPQNLTGLTAVLEDNYLHTSTPISLEESSKVKFTVDANGASKAANRFTITFKRVAQLPAGNVKAGYVISPNPVEGHTMNLQFNEQPKGNYTVRLLNTAGQVMSSNKLAHPGGSAVQVVTLPAKLTPGIYQVDITGAGKTKATQSVLIK